MDPELKAKWVAALRSGEYQQGKKTLLNTSNGTYCSLGVLCRVMGLPNDTIEKFGELNELYHRPLDDVDEEMPSVAEKCGLDGKMPISGHHEAILMIMNDDRQLSFSKIADYIEENI